jgi:hypothetical protein
MAKTYTSNFKRRTGGTSGSEPSYLLEITHPQLVSPIRVINDNADLISNGNTFQACAFHIQFPDDVSGSMPRVPISIDNIGRELTQWLESSDGGRNAQVRIMQVMRDTPDVIEQECTLFLLNTNQSMTTISGQLGYENVLDQPALGAMQTPQLQPGIF